MIEIHTIENLLEKMLILIAFYIIYKLEVNINS